MNQSPEDFRDRLIRAQKMSPEYERRYRQEVEDIINQRLTPTQRRLQLAGAVLFLAVGVFWFLLPSLGDQLGEVPPLRSILIGVMFVIWSGYFAWTAWRGLFDPRVQPVIAGALSLVIPIIIGATLIPGSLRELREYVVAISIVVLILLLLVAARLIQLDYRTKERLLELNYRVAELAEKLEQPRQD